jgi:MFS superfamily sulfate permease-like transporter
MLQALNIFFFTFHTVLVLFNVLGWMWKPTRRWNLVTLAATAFSWFVRGFWYGVGYCLCTDWHMQVRKALGYHDTAQTYIQLVTQSLTGTMPPTELTEKVTATVFVVSLIGSLVLNIRDVRDRSRAPVEA